MQQAYAESKTAGRSLEDIESRSCPSAWAVRWYLRYSRSYRDLEELLAERGIDVYRSVDQDAQVIDV